MSKLLLQKRVLREREQETFGLLIFEHVSGRPRLPGLPSWCPNLSTNRDTINFVGNYNFARVSTQDKPFLPRVDKIHEGVFGLLSVKLQDQHIVPWEKLDFLNTIFSFASLAVVPFTIVRR
jgi:hypothetical protein